MIFKKGDLVPTWINKIEPEHIQQFATFSIDVDVERGVGGVAVYPREPVGEKGIMHVDAKGETLKITGAPTTFYGHPKGDPLNADILSVWPSSLGDLGESPK